jgi:hypothetical protein
MSMSKSPGGSSALLSKRPFLWAALAFCVVLLVLFRHSFVPDLTLFSNDGPLGTLSAECGKYPSGFFGVWNDLNWLGSRGIGASPNLSSILGWAAKPILFSKIYPPFALFLVGAAAWFLFRQLGFQPIVCLLGGVAAILNSSVFSIACWGLPAWSLARAMVYLGLGLLVSPRIKNTWLRAALAGFAVGMGVMEGFDVGAIYSLYFAAFVFFLALIESGQVSAQQAATGALRVAVVAACAVFIAAQSLSALVETQVQGVSGTAQDTQTKEQHWDWATQWSLPKIEFLRVIIPGLFGYRMDTPDGGTYWGGVGRQPGWEQHHQGLVRHSGSGEYAGVLVVLIALWAVAQALRGAKSPFPDRQRKFVLFWVVAGLVSVLLAYGRHAPFYQMIYRLPYFSTIRNPIKFMNPFQLAVTILFCYGLQDLFVRYLAKPRPRNLPLREYLRQWWATAAAPDKTWTRGMLIAFGVALAGLLIYTSSRTELERYLTSVAFDAAQAKAIASFSLCEVVWFIGFFAASGALLVLILSGWLSGSRATAAVVFLGLLLVLDLGRADRPWIVYYNYRDKYASNPVLDLLRDRPFDHRVAARLAPLSGNYLATGDAQGLFAGILDGEWLQHQYPFYNIQSLDIVQMPRVPEMDLAYMTALSPKTPRDFFHVGRLWQLTNTRYILGMTGFLDLINRDMDPTNRSFRVKTTFDFAQRDPAGGADGSTDTGITTVINPNGKFAIFELGAALPRAMLFRDWQVMTDDSQALERLAEPTFDPRKTVLVANAFPAPAGSSTAGADAGTVSITQYEPKHLTLKSEANSSTVLLLNDRFDPHWKVTVDGKPAPLLRCNYIMQGVSLPAGNHLVEFRFEPPHWGFFVSLAGVGFGLMLAGLAWLGKPAPDSAARTDSTAPAAKVQARVPNLKA